MKPVRNYVFEAIAQAELPPLLALGPKGEDVPAGLISLVNEAVSSLAACRCVLDEAPTRVLEHAVVVEISSAWGIPLSQFSLEIRKRHPGSVVAVLVHRGSTLNCGRRSGRSGLDFVGHFRTRGLDPKGHPYVAFVRVRRDRIRTELNAILRNLEETERK